MTTRSARSAITALLVLAAMLALAGQPARRAAAVATTRYVDAAAGGANDGTSWANAYTDLQSALGAAVNGDQVWVAAGIYTPGAARTDSFLLESGVAIYGGFAGGETSTAQRDIAANPSVLSGDIPLSGVVSNNSYHVVQGGSVGPSARLDGFTIRDGYADGAAPATTSMGGGLYLTTGSPTLANLVFSTNFAGTSGGGGASPTCLGIPR